MFASVRYLFRLRYFLPIPIKIVLAQSLVKVVWSCCLDLKEEQLNKFQASDYKILLFRLSLDYKSTNVSDFRRKLKWLPIRLRRIIHILHLLFCVQFDPLTPSYLKECFNFLGHSHSRHLRSAYNLSLKIPSHSFSFFSNSFTTTPSRL